MCRNIKTLLNFNPPATDEEIRAASLQFVRKLSGFNAPSKANERAFNEAIDEVADVARRLIDSLTTHATPRNREEVAAAGAGAIGGAVRTVTDARGGDGDATALAPQRWSAERYVQHAAFVPAFGASLLEWLAPRAGERILDLGCGDGTLTRQIAERGAVVVGVDASTDFVAAARKAGIDARFGDAQSLAFDGEFDAVFSNAVLHWVQGQQTRHSMESSGRCGPAAASSPSSAATAASRRSCSRSPSRCSDAATSLNPGGISRPPTNMPRS